MSPSSPLINSLANLAGHELEGACSGLLVIKRPWPSIMRTVAGDHARFERTYFEHFKVPRMGRGARRGGAAGRPMGGGWGDPPKGLRRGCERATQQRAQEGGEGLSGSVKPIALKPERSLMRGGLEQREEKEVGRSVRPW